MSIEDLREIQEKEGQARAGKRCGVAVCSAASCESAGGDSAREALDAAVQASEKGEEIDVFGTGCLGLCHAGPLVQVTDPGGTHLYHRVDEAAARRIVDEHAVKGMPVEELLATDVGAFFDKQHPIVLEGSGRIDPERIESCVAAGAYESLYKAITEMTPADVIQEVTTSGLRGRGGGGYPTGLKWSTVFKAKGQR